MLGHAQNAQGTVLYPVMFRPCVRTAQSPPTTRLPPTRPLTAPTNAFCLSRACLSWAVLLLAVPLSRLIMSSMHMRDAITASRGKILRILAALVWFSQELWSSVVWLVLMCQASVIGVIYAPVAALATPLYPTGLVLVA